MLQMLDKQLVQHLYIQQFFGAKSVTKSTDSLIVLYIFQFPAIIGILIVMYPPFGVIIHQLVL